MPANTRTATAITNADATPRVLNQPHLTGAYQREAIGVITKATGDGDNSVLRFVRVRSSDRITGLAIINAVLAGATHAIVGFYDTPANGGAMIGTGNQLMIDQSIAGGNPTKTGILTGLAPADAEKRVWELMGTFSSDPGKDFDIAMTLSTAGSAAGAIALYVTYVAGN